MDVLEAIHTRRSIRRFVPHRPVSEEELQQLLAAAMNAPSAGNAQPWHFVVVTDPGLKDLLAEVHPYVGMLRQAPMGIVVCADPALEKYPGYWVQDCSAAVQNLLLAARALGLGTVWTGLHPVAEREARVREILKLPASIVPLAIVPVGVPEQPFSRQDRYRPERVHHNAW